MGNGGGFDLLAFLEAGGDAKHAAFVR